MRHSMSLVCISCVFVSSFTGCGKSKDELKAELTIAQVKLDQALTVLEVVKADKKIVDQQAREDFLAAKIEFQKEKEEFRKKERTLEKREQILDESKKTFAVKELEYEKKKKELETEKEVLQEEVKKLREQLKGVKKEAPKVEKTPKISYRTDYETEGELYAGQLEDEVQKKLSVRKARFDLWLQNERNKNDIYCATSRGQGKIYYHIRNRFLDMEKIVVDNFEKEQQILGELWLKESEEKLSIDLGKKILSAKTKEMALK